MGDQGVLEAGGRDGERRGFAVLPDELSSGCERPFVDDVEQNAAVLAGGGIECGLPFPGLECEEIHEADGHIGLLG